MPGDTANPVPTQSPGPTLASPLPAPRCMSETPSWSGRALPGRPAEGRPPPPQSHRSRFTIVIKEGTASLSLIDPSVPQTNTRNAQSLRPSSRGQRWPLSALTGSGSPSIPTPCRTRSPRPREVEAPHSADAAEGSAPGSPQPRGGQQAARRSPHRGELSILGPNPGFTTSSRLVWGRRAHGPCLQGGGGHSTSGLSPGGTEWVHARCSDARWCRPSL